LRIKMGHSDHVEYGLMSVNLPFSGAGCPEKAQRFAR